jgi:hypothetical protein
VYYRVNLQKNMEIASETHRLAERGRSWLLLIETAWATE